MTPLHPLAVTLNETFQKQSPQIFSLLSKRGVSAYFPKLGILSQAADADGKTINATIGIALDEDKTPLHTSTIAKAVNLPAKDVFPYTPSYGKKPLRDKWQEEIRKKNPSLKADISLPVVNAGLTHSLSVAGYLFLDPGEEIIQPDMYWDNYELIFEEAYGAILTMFQTFEGQRFNVAGLRKTLEQKSGKQVVFLNFPNNPTGYTPLTSEMQDIAQALKESAERGNKIVVLIDDAYFGLIYDEGVYTESLFSLVADLHENILAVKVDGATKEEFAWGMRIGFLTYAGKGMTKDTLKVLEEKTAGVVRGTVSNCSHMAQSLILQALQTPGYEEEKHQKFELLKTRFQNAKKEVANPQYQDQFTMLPCNSGYFLCLKLRDGLDAELVRQKLLHDYSTGIIALGSLIRVAFSSVPNKDLPTLFSNIYAACQTFS